MHISSVEVRWFWSGSLNTYPDLKAGFDGFAPIERRNDVKPPDWSKERKDVYLVIPSAVDLGIKWREGELQTKGRRALLGEMNFGGVHGVLEQWTKWSHEGPAVDSAFKPLFFANGQECVIEVTKRRALRKIRLDPLGSWQEVPAGEQIDRGVGYELTELKVKDAGYCSLAFEAFPDDSELYEQFTQVVSAFVRGFEAAIFRNAVSESYPAWLNQFAHVSLAQSG